MNAITKKNALKKRGKKLGTKALVNDRSRLFSTRPGRHMLTTREEGQVT